MLSTKQLKDQDNEANDLSPQPNNIKIILRNFTPFFLLIVYKYIFLILKIKENSEKKLKNI